MHFGSRLSAWSCTAAHDDDMETPAQTNVGPAIRSADTALAPAPGLNWILDSPRDTALGLGPRTSVRFGTTQAMSKATAAGNARLA
jgi:hypothetical protein